MFLNINTIFTFKIFLNTNIKYYKPQKCLVKDIKFLYIKIVIVNTNFIIYDNY